MARLRYNNAAGTIASGSPLASDAGPDTITFAAAPGFATIVAPDYIPLILDPPVGVQPNPSFEIVYLTAYTAGATTGTITRAQEGTTSHGHNGGAIWAQAPTKLDITSQAPVGSIIPYAGSGDPPETNWLIADGRLIDAVVYTDFDHRTGSGGGHKYNGGVSPGTNGLGHAQVRIPDKRGKKSIGAINMGSSAGTGANDNAHFQAAQGASYGEVNHGLSAAELAPHPHAVNINSGLVSNDHSHFTSGTTATFGGGWVPATANNGAAWQDLTAPTSGPGGYTSANFPYASGGYINHLTTHGHGFGAQSGGVSANHYHNTSGNTDNGAGLSGAGHNNVDPCEADSYIVRIA